MKLILIISHFLDVLAEADIIDIEPFSFYTLRH
jgi:hypothetical protein